MSELRLQLEQAIAALEQQRALLGDDVVIRAIQPLQDKLRHGATHFALHYQWCEIALIQEALYFSVFRTKRATNLG